MVAGINPFDFGWQLAPGEAFEAPALVCGYSEEGLGGAARLLHRFEADTVLPARHRETESYEAKCRRGATPRPLWAVTSLPGPDPDSLAGTARRLAASMPAHESGAFVAEVERSHRRWTASGA